MSPHRGEPDPPISNSKARSLHRYLHKRLGERETDEYYFKCKDIADELGMTPKEMSCYVRQLRSADLDIHIEKWSWARATTWRVRYRDSG